MKSFNLVFLMIFAISALAAAQVQVSKEPRHKPVLENEYVRMLDVVLPPADTTWFHIHSTPSVFLQFTGSNLATQVKDADWIKEQSEKGTVWFNPFLPDRLVHRVSNQDTKPFHVTDIEILSSYKPASGLIPMPFPVLLNNEKVFAYRVTEPFGNKQLITGRGPIIAALVEGNEVVFHDAGEKRTTKLEPGKFVYISPQHTFYFSTTDKEKINLVLFEIK
jgi:hypothetical protein